MMPRSRSTIYPTLAIAFALCGCSGAGSSDNLVMSDVGNLGGASSTLTGGSPSTSKASGTGGNTSLGGNSTSVGGTGSTSEATALGGDTGTGGAAPTGGASSTSVSFDWGTTSYNVNGGSSVSYQSHYNGLACLASCHTHTFQAGGTVYAANGTTAAANVQIGIRINGTLYTGYSGSGGNFYLRIPGTLDWASSQIAIRNVSGTAVHPSTPGLSGNCSSCHDSSNRIKQP